MSRDKKAEVVIFANEILNFSRNKLLVNLRFMNVALSYHERIAYEGSLATDGKTLLYDPRFVLQTYKKSQEEMVRMYLHMVLHCVFRHPFIDGSVNERLWSLACDMAVECAINDLGLNGVSSVREEKQNQIVSKIGKELKILTAEKIYSLLRKADYPDWTLTQWETAFKADDHTPWYMGTFRLINLPIQQRLCLWRMDMRFLMCRHGRSGWYCSMKILPRTRKRYEYKESQRTNQKRNDRLLYKR